LFTTILRDAPLAFGSVNFAQPEKSMMQPTALAFGRLGKELLLHRLRKPIGKRRLPYPPSGLTRLFGYLGFQS
jgi:hypothetical protein